jgi:hypothetical protein
MKACNIDTDTKEKVNVRVIENHVGMWVLDVCSYASSLSFAMEGSGELILLSNDISIKKSLAFRRALLTACNKASKNGYDVASIHHGITIT